VALADVVIDTDVLMHAENPETSEYQTSRGFIEQLIGSNTAVCFDLGFDTDEARNRSAIASEYFNHLPPGSLGLAMIYECALADRVRTVSTKVSAAVNRAIRQLIWDKSDQKFVKVVVNSEEHVLVTHNDSHFGPAAAQLASQLNVEVLDGYACTARL
jgi:hypothetical protein